MPAPVPGILLPRPQGGWRDLQLRLFDSYKWSVNNDCGTQLDCGTHNIGAGFDYMLLDVQLGRAALKHNCNTAADARCFLH
jgi:hypothetical protein